MKIHCTRYSPPRFQVTYISKPLTLWHLKVSGFNIKALVTFLILKEITFLRMTKGSIEDDALTVHSILCSSGKGSDCMPPLASKTPPPETTSFCSVCIFASYTTEGYGQEPDVSVLQLCERATF